MWTRPAGARSALISSPHPAVPAAVAAWHQRKSATALLNAWLAALPDLVERGDIPSQADADHWASRHTDGLIDRFPVTVDELTVVLLASALTTQVSWETPFDVVPAVRLGLRSPWASRLAHVLRRGGGCIASTHRAGDVAVHTASSAGGLQVTSVIAAADVPAAEVLSVAYELAMAAARGRDIGRSLFDLPLGEGPAWTLTERQVRTTAPSGREERCTTLVPAWSATDDHDLASLPGLGFGLAAKILEPMLAPDPRGFRFDARQSVLARYTRTGFEAAAVTGMGLRSAGTVEPPASYGRRREAELRFGHPFATVAVVGDVSSTLRGPWFGVPVFSAWIVDPDDAPDEEDDLNRGYG